MNISLLFRFQNIGIKIIAFDVISKTLALDVIIHIRCSVIITKSDPNDFLILKSECMRSSKGK